MTLRWIFGAAWLLCMPITEAFALAKRDAYALARNGQIGTLEIAFTQHQEAFRSGRISPDEFRAPYFVFGTSDPRVTETTAAWLSQHPDSASAKTARGVLLAHHAMLYRGGDAISATPLKALQAMHTAFDEAKGQLSAALDSEETQLAAAWQLAFVGLYSGDRSVWPRALATIDEYDRPERALFGRLELAVVRWGGDPGESYRICEERTPDLPEIDYEACLAIAYFINGDASTEVLNRIPDVVAEFFPGIAVSKLANSGRLEDAFDLAKRSGIQRTGLASEVAKRRGDAAIAIDYMERALEPDPYNPFLLDTYFTILIDARKPEKIRELLDRGLMFGRYAWRIRHLRLRRLPLEDQIVEIDAILEDLDRDYATLSMLAEHIQWDLPKLKAKAKQMGDEGFECRAIRILEEHVEACKDVPEQPEFELRLRLGQVGCSSGTNFTRDEILKDAKINGLCGLSEKGSWQDTIRGLLGIEE